MDHERIRADAHEELAQLAHEHAEIDHIETFTRDEAEDNLGQSWTNLANIYFDESETIGTVHTLRDALDDNDYLVTIEDENGQTCLVVQVTRDLFTRLE